MTLNLAPVPMSAREARRVLADQGLARDVEHRVLLLTTEMVGNAVRHANLAPDDHIELSAWLAGDFARVQVADRGTGFDPATVVTEGYGLKLLGRLAERWAVECDDDGCRVWFEVGRRPSRFTRVG